MIMKKVIFLYFVFILLILSTGFVLAGFVYNSDGDIEVGHTHPELESVYNCTIISPGQTEKVDVSGFYGAEKWGWTIWDPVEHGRAGGILYSHNLTMYESNEVYNSQITHQKSDDEIIVDSGIYLDFTSNSCESIKSVRIIKCVDTMAELESADTIVKESAFDIKECGEREICLNTKGDPNGGRCIEMEQVCPAKISWKSDGKIIAPEHYPNIFIKVYDSENNAVDAIISYAIYLNSELREEDVLIRVPKEGLEIIEGEDLKEFVETNTNTVSYKIIYSSPFPDCGIEEIIEFTIKDSMTIFDKIAEFFRLVF